MSERKLEKVDIEEDDRKKRAKEHGVNSEQNSAFSSLLAHEMKLNEDNNKLAKSNNREYRHHERNRMRWYIRVELRYVQFLQDEVNKANDLETITRLRNDIEVTKGKYFNFYNRMGE